MNFWTALVAIVAMGSSIGTIAIISTSRVNRARIKAGSGKSEEHFNALSDRVGRMEKRMVNLETIVLDKEKEKKFENL